MGREDLRPYVHVTFDVYKVSCRKQDTNSLNFTLIGLLV